MLKFTLELGQSSLTEMIKLEVYLTEQLRKLYQLMKNDVWSKAQKNTQDVDVVPSDSYL